MYKIRAIFVFILTVLAVGPLVPLIIEVKINKGSSKHQRICNEREQKRRQQQQTTKYRAKQSAEYLRGETSQKAELYNLSSLLVLIFNKIYSL